MLAGVPNSRSTFSSLYTTWPWWESLSGALLPADTVRANSVITRGLRLNRFLTVELMRNLVEEGDIVVIEFGNFENSIKHNVHCSGSDPTATCERYA